MIISFRKWSRRVRFVCIFIMFVYLLFHLLGYVTDWIIPKDKYKTPLGHAVKAFHHRQSDQEQGSIMDRLRLFYWYGE